MSALGTRCGLGSNPAMDGQTDFVSYCKPVVCPMECLTATGETGCITLYRGTMWFVIPHPRCSRTAYGNYRLHV